MINDLFSPINLKDIEHCLPHPHPLELWGSFHYRCSTISNGLCFSIREPLVIVDRTSVAGSIPMITSETVHICYWKAWILNNGEKFLFCFLFFAEWDFLDPLWAHSENKEHIEPNFVMIRFQNRTPGVLMWWTNGSSRILYMMTYNVHVHVRGSWRW